MLKSVASDVVYDYNVDLIGLIFIESFDVCYFMCVQNLVSYFEED